MADLPPHRYVPGRTDRHPEDGFDPIKGSVTEEIPPEQLHRTAAWTTGLAYFEAGYFWECHELLEAVWMRTPEASAERDMVQAIIQLANARLKLRMERPRAAWRLCEMVEAHLGRCPADRETLGLDPDDILQLVEETRQQIGAVSAP